MKDIKDNTYKNTQIAGNVIFENVEYLGEHTISGIEVSGWVSFPKLKSIHAKAFENVKVGEDVYFKKLKVKEKLLAYRSVKYLYDMPPDIIE